MAHTAGKIIIGLVLLGAGAQAYENGVGPYRQTHLEEMIRDHAQHVVMRGEGQWCSDVGMPSDYRAEVCNIDKLGPFTFVTQYPRMTEGVGIHVTVRIDGRPEGDVYHIDGHGLLDRMYQYRGVEFQDGEWTMDRPKDGAWFGDLWKRVSALGDADDAKDVQAHQKEVEEDAAAEKRAQAAEKEKMSKLAALYQGELAKAR